MAQARRTNSRNSLLSEKNTNRSNNNVPGIKRASSTDLDKKVITKQNSSSSLKILGQDGEVSEDVLLNGSHSDRSTPVSSRSQMSSRPGSSSWRTPTPSKQISLQAVKRKEESAEPLEPINWDDIDKPLIVEDRIPKLPVSDSDSDIGMPQSAEERLKQMTTGLSTSHMEDEELDLSRKLELIETAREERERREKDRQLQVGHKLTVEDGQITYRNEHFRDLSKRDKRDKIDGDFILDGKGGAYYNESVTVGAQPESRKRRGENTIGRHPMDKLQETVISAESKEEGKDESAKKNEASGDVESSSGDDSDEEENDWIGEKGKAPNNLLMEFLSSMMEEDYETAEKLCRMILIYEPENPEALSFYPLIQEKIKQEEEEGDDDDDDDDSDEESDDSGEEEDSDDDDDDEEDDDEDENDNESAEESEEENMIGNQPDSGIASANSD